MGIYVDTSVVLRNVFDEPGQPIAFWTMDDVPRSSDLVRVEAARALQRRRLDGELDDDTLAAASLVLQELLDRLGEIVLDRHVLDRAAGAFPSRVRTLDALHLASAVLWREHGEQVSAFLTHDNRQATAARALGFRVVGGE